MYLLYSALLAAGLLISLPYWMFGKRRHGKYREGLGERLGKVPSRLQGQAAPAIWIHAVSVGEVLAVSELVKELRQRFPQYRVLVSTTTATGQKLAKKRFGEERVFYFPLDLGFAIRPYLTDPEAGLIVIAETEFWPNFLRLARKSGARIAVVNPAFRIDRGRDTGERSASASSRAVLRNIDLFLAQTEEDARRLRDIGAPAERVQVSGNLKFDVEAPAPPPIVASLRAAFQQSGCRADHRLRQHRRRGRRTAVAGLPECAGQPSSRGNDSGAAPSRALCGSRATSRADGNPLLAPLFVGRRLGRWRRLPGRHHRRTRFALCAGRRGVCRWKPGATRRAQHYRAGPARRAYHCRKPHRKF